ncbi:MAG: purine-nucleoside phosphorylase [Chloroflexi bacterium]|nr:purine-nucleoside phosphorylase [Chloroflexota bacterium]MBS60557.1 purine-nucleoside phosphorylase [Anaerolineaceae bacterium]|tara:strand:+ start:7350 stop:8189 length:840 start_codon:yes stop_codon:yes gene_type:complete
MTDHVHIEQFKEISDLIERKSAHRPKIGMILGSGLGLLADEIDDADYVKYSQIPHWPESTVEGHSGQLVIGNLEGQSVVVMQGRAHYYEGYSMAQIGLPVRVMKLLGVETLFVTNAAGGVNPEFEPGDLMLITDHINLIGMGGLSPLRGQNIDSMGPRFPDMMNAYNDVLRDIAVQTSIEMDIGLRQGIYVSLAGPNFETPADLRFLQVIGADAVGMSTVPEVIVARHSGIRVLGVSGISNKANLDGNTPTSHEEVIEAGRVIVPKLVTMIRGVLRNIG